MAEQQRARSRRPDISKVNETAALRALAEAESRQNAWTAYIIHHYRLTGQLAPGCDLHEFAAWVDEFARAAARERLAREKQPQC